MKVDRAAVSIKAMKRSIIFLGSIFCMSALAFAQIKGTIVGNSCEVWDFKTTGAEAKNLAEFVANEMKIYKLKPRDFSICGLAAAWIAAKSTSSISPAKPSATTTTTWHK